MNDELSTDSANPQRGAELFLKDNDYLDFYANEEWTSMLDSELDAILEKSKGKNSTTSKRSSSGEKSRGSKKKRT